MPVMFGARQEFGPKEEERRQFLKNFVSHAKNDGNLNEHNAPSSWVSWLLPTPQFQDKELSVGSRPISSGLTDTQLATVEEENVER